MESLAMASGPSSSNGVPQQNGTAPAQGGNGTGGNTNNAAGQTKGPSMVLMDVVPRAKDIQWRTRAMWASHDAATRSATAFNTMLETTYERLLPTQNDHSMRLQLLERLNSLIQPCAPGSRVVIFGSFETNVYTPTGDLDLSLVLPDTGVVRFNHEHVELRGGPLSKTQRVKILRIVRRVLSRAVNHMDNGARYSAFNQMDLVAGARVPVLNFVDVMTRVKCDISINNDGALFKSRVLRWVLELDDRCRPLVCLVKAWARAQGINDSRNGTLNSYAISLLVVFHLQTRSPPILPSFEAVLSSNYHELRKGVNMSEVRITEDQLLAAHARVQALRGVKEQQAVNTSSLGELLASFFTQYANVESLWAHGLTASPWSATWKEARQAHTAWFGKQYIMRVEDPFDLSENCARSVTPGRVGFLKICAAIRTAANALQTPPTTGRTVDAHVAVFGHQMIPPRTTLRPNSAPRKVVAGAGPEEAAQWWGQQNHVPPGAAPQGHVSPRPPYRPPGLYESSRERWAPEQGHVAGSGLNHGGFTAPFLANRSPQSHVMAMLEALTPANSPGALTPGPHLPLGFLHPKEGSLPHSGGGSLPLSRGGSLPLSGGGSLPLSGGGSLPPSPAERFPSQSIGGSSDSEPRPADSERSPTPPSMQSPQHPSPSFSAIPYPPQPASSRSLPRNPSQDSGASSSLHQPSASPNPAHNQHPNPNPNPLKSLSNPSPLVQNSVDKPASLTASVDVSNASRGQNEGANPPPHESSDHAPYPVPELPVRPPSEPEQPTTKPPPPGKNRFRPTPNSFPRRRPPIPRPAEYMHELEEDRSVVRPNRGGKATGNAQSRGGRVGNSHPRGGSVRQVVDARTSVVANGQSRTMAIYGQGELEQ